MSTATEVTGCRDVHPCAERMSQLCESFHALQGWAGVRPWNQLAFAKYASGPAPTAASRQAAAFVLSVWNGGNHDAWWNKKPYRVGIFDAVNGIARWDSHMQAAFIAWCQDPFWP
jgi:hypothetical protein